MKSYSPIRCHMCGASGGTLMRLGKVYVHKPMTRGPDATHMRSGCPKRQA